MSRPSNELILEREEKVEIEIPIAKDGSYSLPDDTEAEEIDAACYDKIYIDTVGYGDKPIPDLHKAKAFQGLYKTDIYFDEEADIFAEELVVVQEIGGTEYAPEFTVRHVLASPGENS